MYWQFNFNGTWMKVAKFWCDVIFICISFRLFYLVWGLWVNLLHASIRISSLRWRHNDHDCVSNHQPYDCLLNRLFRRKSKKTSKLRVTGLCVGNSPGPVNSPHKGPVTRKMFPFDDVIMWYNHIPMKHKNLCDVLWDIVCIFQLFSWGYNANKQLGRPTNNTANPTPENFTLGQGESRCH